jgi:hypothetical protein
LEPEADIAFSDLSRHLSSKLQIFSSLKLYHYNVGPNYFLHVLRFRNLILLVALGPGVYSASNRNEYQKHKNNVSGE